MSDQYSHIVLGLGATGLSVVRYLCAQGVVPLVMDSRQIPPSAELLANTYPQVTLMKGDFDADLLCQATQIIISPGIPLSTPEIGQAIEAGVEVIGDVELFARAIQDKPACVIAITGSNGKTTVTTLVAEMTKAAGMTYAVGGNIGIPVLDLLMTPVDLYILELSSFQLETTHSLQCIAGTCLNIFEDHMDRYSSIEAYRQVKLGLYAQSERAFFNRDDKLTFANTCVQMNSFGLRQAEGNNWGLDEGYVVKGDTRIMPVSELVLVGKHNQANVIAAMALADVVGISHGAMKQVAREFSGVAHRCEVVNEVQGVLYINDSKATNVGATLAALEGLETHAGNVILIAGGDSKDADFSPLIGALANVRALITLGKDGDRIGQLKADYYPVIGMKEAVLKAREIATVGDIVLLSPACASLDMYVNFMARGDDFKAQVRQLVNHDGVGYTPLTEAQDA
ncbi:UDP-N-acetylmuramoyl-L-alanine--D-glutamate ligase [Shewanella surugensis]|uniref:UDP-N-acetylmuramoylalanine--D-glutamate ligase n=1 Tax=Shewanella surugensis TaxID=212020 RepID=A0ABT0L875_9GAMM|nr:UDP-N-acetylmuramoyl-L-alanine--D-glutamate ligase [Shewanella surugensis]MCL1123595.1 UDP-N-acetylmuramoyl-L-alanine--D-glutamate ligase [Shewanella surugensis]